MNQSKKIALGGGGYCLYAPTFPRFQLTPGFADEVSIFSALVPRLFVISLLEDGKLLHLECSKQTMRNGNLVLEYSANAKGLKFVETRSVTTDDRFVSQIAIENSTKSERDFTLVMWTTTDPEGEAPSLEGDSFRIRRNLAKPDESIIPTEIVYSSPDSKGARCLQGFFAEGGSDRPDYEETPWFDMADMPTPRAKRPMVKPSPILPTAKVYLGLFRALKMKPASKAAHRFEANVIFKGKGINYRPRRPDAKDENSYSAYMDKAPKFVCESKEIERIVKHRIETLRLLRMPNGVGNISSPNVCLGNGHLHVPNAFAAPAIMREARWLADPSVGRGILKGFFDNIRQNGMVPANLHLGALSNTEFVHSDWGGGFEALDSSHPDRATKRAVIMGMQRYSKWLANNRDPEGSGLTDICNHIESGQDLSRRFTVIDEKSDRATGSEEQFRLKGVDASIFRYKLVRYLAKVADELQEKAMANRFIAATEVIHEVIRKRMWDEKSGIFMDIDPKTRRKTGVKSAVGFYPLATDIPTPKQVDALCKTLSDRKEFWTKYPVPSVAISDPYFDPDGRWKETRRETPWNGRSWPMINSQILEGLCYVAERGHKHARKLTKDLFNRSISMMSGELDGVEEPRVFEHYNPINGRPARFRGIDLCMHSFVMDNIFRVACGIAVRFGEVQNDPVIDDMPDFKLQGIPVGNKRYTAERKGSRFKVTSE